MPNEAKFAFTTNEITIALRNTQELAERVRDAMTANTTKAEREQIDRIIGAIAATREAALDIECPNPYYGFYTVDMDVLFGSGDGPGIEKK
jgi:hypothetical protein